MPLLFHCLLISLFFVFPALGEDAKNEGRKAPVTADPVSPIFATPWDAQAWDPASGEFWNVIPLSVPVSSGHPHKKRTFSALSGALGDQGRNISGPETK